MIDLRRLQVLRVLARHETVTATAEALHLTPSAVSWQIRQLSAELGVSLLAQHGRGVRLTPAARILLERADELYARWEEIHADLAAHTGEVTGSLRLCGFSTAAATVLPPTATALGRAHPHLAVRITEAEPVEAFNLLLADEVDVAVVVATPTLPPMTDARFEQQTLLDDPLDLLLPADHPLAGRATVALAETAGQPWIVDRPGSSYRQLVVAACATAGFSPAIAHEASELALPRALAQPSLTRPVNGTPGPPSSREDSGLRSYHGSRTPLPATTPPGSRWTATPAPPDASSPASAGGAENSPPSPRHCIPSPTSRKESTSPHTEIHEVLADNRPAGKAATAPRQRRLGRGGRSFPD